MSATGTELAALSARWSPGDRLTALKRILPRADVATALRRTGRDRSFCKCLPAWLVVWVVVGLGLFRGDSHRQAFRRLVPAGRAAPGRPTLCEARARVGPRPLALLCRSAIRLLAAGPAAVPSAFYAGLRLMALDGFVLDVADSPANDRAFGRPGSGRGRSAFPQVRVLSLCEAGTHVLWRSLVKRVGCGECSMAPGLLRHLTPGMLLLWDRGFFKHAHVGQVLDQGAHLLARVKTGLVLVPTRRLADGSYLAKAYRTAHDRKHDRDGLVVRVVDYTLGDPGRPGHGQRHRLLTTLLDAAAHPAATLVELYHVRWEVELAIDELKTHQGGREPLRSRTPAGVIQEVHGLLLAHFAVRSLMAEAAAAAGVPPTRVSFAATLQVLAVRLPQCPRSPAAGRRWRAAVVAEVAAEVLPPRRDRSNPRVVKRKMSKWLKKRPAHAAHPKPTMPFADSIAILR